MKFKAISTEGKEIIAKYFVGADEDVKNWCEDETLIEKYGTDLCFMFDDTIGWIDGSELNGIFKDVVFANSIEMIKD